MMAAHSRTNGNAPSIGDTIEDWVTERFGYEHADETYYDHVGRTYGRKIQVKGTQKWIQNGYDKQGDPNRTRGRWRLWENDHAKLKAVDGVYLLILYEEPDATDDIEVTHWEFVSPEQLEESLPGDWHDVNNFRADSKGRSHRLNWGHILDPEVVDE